MSGETERRNTGGAMEAKRRAIGKSISDDLSRIVSITAPKAGLKVLDKRGSLPAKKGRGEFAGTKSNSSGGGIASPLTEIQGADSREYYEESSSAYFWSSDYLMAVELKPLKVLRLKDADNQDVELEFKKPVAGAS